MWRMPWDLQSRGCPLQGSASWTSARTAAALTSPPALAARSSVGPPLPLPLPLPEMPGPTSTSRRHRHRALDRRFASSLPTQDQIGPWRRTSRACWPRAIRARAGLGAAPDASDKSQHRQRTDMPATFVGPRCGSSSVRWPTRRASLSRGWTAMPSSCRPSHWRSCWFPPVCSTPRARLLPADGSSSSRLRLPKARAVPGHRSSTFLTTSSSCATRPRHAG
mmetsp:Transcript_25509/g.82129  ORF Transcript_25509/g.82129 Transcript_25509/m.82129 type:complete len:221 (-) Transcript_25509:369-1031(-)